MVLNNSSYVRIWPSMDTTICRFSNETKRQLRKLSACFCSTLSVALLAELICLCDPSGQEVGKCSCYSPLLCRFASCWPSPISWSVSIRLTQIVMQRSAVDIRMTICSMKYCHIFLVSFLTLLACIAACLWASLGTCHMRDEYVLGHVILDSTCVEILSSSHEHRWSVSHERMPSRRTIDHIFNDRRKCVNAHSQSKPEKLVKWH